VRLFIVYSLDFGTTFLNSPKLNPNTNPIKEKNKGVSRILNVYDKNENVTAYINKQKKPLSMDIKMEIPNFSHFPNRPTFSVPRIKVVPKKRAFKVK